MCTIFFNLLHFIRRISNSFIKMSNTRLQVTVVVFRLLNHIIKHTLKKIVEGFNFEIFVRFQIQYLKV